jgi:hypothetical protein
MRSLVMRDRMVGPWNVTFLRVVMDAPHSGFPLRVFRLGRMWELDVLVPRRVRFTVLVAPNMDGGREENEL